MDWKHMILFLILGYIVGAMYPGVFNNVKGMVSGS